MGLCRCAAHRDSRWGGVIGPDERGIALCISPAIDPYARIQRIQSVTPAANKLILIAARVILDAVGTSRFWFGFWPTETADPLVTEPDNVIAFRKNTDGAGVKWRVRKAGNGLEAVDPQFSFVSDVAVDLGIVIHGTTRADFIWSRGDGTWGSELPQVDIPIVTLRPSLLFKRNNDGGPAIIPSFHVQELVLRE